MNVKGNVWSTAFVRIFIFVGIRKHASVLILASNFVRRLEISVQWVSRLHQYYFFYRTRNYERQSQFRRNLDSERKHWRNIAKHTARRRGHDSSSSLPYQPILVLNCKCTATLRMFIYNIIRMCIVIQMYACVYMRGCVHVCTCENVHSSCVCMCVAGYQFLYKISFGRQPHKHKTIIVKVSVCAVKHFQIFGLIFTNRVTRK